MKKLEISQMENIEGGWSWTKCAVGAYTAWSIGLVGYAGLVAGPVGMVGALGAGCVLSNLV